MTLMCKEAEYYNQEDSPYMSKISNNNNKIYTETWP